MAEVEGKTATEVMKKSIEYVLNEGTKRKVYGGTIPKNIKDPKSPNDFDREMIEADPGMTMVLTNPLARWTDYSNQWIGITLREQEDHFQAYNPGHVIKYSKLYRRWLCKGFFNYTYGERFLTYPYNLKEKGKDKLLYDRRQFNQIEEVIRLLQEHPTTRKSCISTWYPRIDLGDPYCPCNAFMQIRIVNDKLDWITVVRSLDVLRGYSENIFMFTMWQEYIAKKLNVPLGKYTTVALNAHLYQDQIDAGYHKQKVPDCYDFYEVKPAFTEDFPSDKFKEIDDQLFNDKDVNLNLLPFSSFWRNWKLALIADWFRLKNRVEDSEAIASLINNEFKFSVIRRLYKKDKSVIDLLQWDKQKKFLEELHG